MDTRRMRGSDELWYGILSRAEKAANVATARLIRKLPEGTSDEVLASLMNGAADVVAEEIGEVLALVEQALGPKLAALTDACTGGRVIQAPGDLFEPMTVTLTTAK